VGAEAIVDVPVHLVRTGHPGLSAPELPSSVPAPAAPVRRAAEKPAGKIEKQDEPAAATKKPEKSDKKDRRNDPDYLVDPFGAPK